MIDDVKDKATQFAGMTAKKAQESLNQLIEAVVVLIVTNCLLPVLVLVFLIWVMKLILGIQIDMPEHGRGHKHFHRRDMVED